jgi:ABC-2 type transport system ATP-binding protein
MDAPTLSVSGLSVERGGRTIIDGLSLQLRPGEVYALLGGNGSGKSTTLYAILGLLPRQAGELTVNGRDPAREPDAVRASVAYLPENVALYDHLTARENIGYFLEIAGVQRSRDDVAEAFRSVRLDESTWDRRAGGFSKGMRQKTAIALAILRGAPLLLLDEPTSGLDPSASRDFHTLIEDLGRRGVAVLMVTHDLLGAADVADRIGLIDHGRIAREWTAAPTGPRYDLAALHQGFAGFGAAA